MGEVDRISDADRALLARLTTRQRELQRAVSELDGLVQEHFEATYGLKPGDTVEDDGTIVRASQGMADAAG